MLSFPRLPEKRSSPLSSRLKLKQSGASPIVGSGHDDEPVADLPNSPLVQFEAHGPPPRPHIQLARRTVPDTITANAPRRSRREKLPRTPKAPRSDTAGAPQGNAGSEESRCIGAYHEDDTEPEDRVYKPEFPAHQQLAAEAGHGGGDFFMNYHFAEAIRSGEAPYLDVYRGVTMSMIGALAYRSALDDSSTVVVPDFRDHAVRAAYADDDWSPDPTRRQPGSPWPSIEGDVAISDKALEYARGVWREIGYEG